MGVTRRCRTMLHLITTNTHTHTVLALFWACISGHGGGGGDDEEQYVKAEIEKGSTRG